MDPQGLLQSTLPLVDRIVRRVCGRANVVGADVEDFASTVKLALVENDYAILRAYEGRSSLATYLAVVIQRLLADERNRLLGRWRPSAEAKRLGEAAVLLETVIRRDERPLADAIPIVRAFDPTLTPAAIEALAARLPQRSAKLRVVALDDATDVASAERADERAVTAEAQRLSARANALIQATLETLPLQDRMLVRLRFAAMMNISDIARILRVEQRPLYRRLESVLATLRRTLIAGGIDATAASDLIDSAVSSLDFQLSEGKSEAFCQSPSNERPHEHRLS